MVEPEISGYRWQDPDLNCSHAYLAPALLGELEKLAPEDKRLFDVGWGNGIIANLLSGKGWNVTGVDPSKEALTQANTHYPDLKIFHGSAYDDLSIRFGRFPVLISLEVVEHVYAPRDYADTLFSLLELGGTAIIPTPYHGYWKNLAMAISGKMDEHFTALWDHGHIKFWSIKTLTASLEEAGFRDVRFRLVGRIPVLAKSMIAICKKP